MASHEKRHPKYEAPEGFSSARSFSVDISELDGASGDYLGNAATKAIDIRDNPKVPKPLSELIGRIANALIHKGSERHRSRQ